MHQAKVFSIAIFAFIALVYGGGNSFQAIEESTIPVENPTAQIQYSFWKGYLYGGDPIDNRGYMKFTLFVAPLTTIITSIPPDIPSLQNIVRAEQNNDIDNWMIKSKTNYVLMNVSAWCGYPFLLGWLFSNRFGHDGDFFPQNRDVILFSTGIALHTIAIPFGIRSSHYARKSINFFNSIRKAK